MAQHFVFQFHDHSVGLNSGDEYHGDGSDGHDDIREDRCLECLQCNVALRFSSQFHVLVERIVQCVLS